MADNILHRFFFRFEVFLFSLAFLIMTLIAILQSLKLNAGFITNYGADIFGPIVLYYWTRKNMGLLAILFKNKITAIQTFLIILICCFAWEMRQFINPSTGTFDPFDILTYSLTLFASLYFDI